MLSAQEAAAQDPAGADALTFRAGKVEADATLRELTLERDVLVTYGRYRLWSDRLHLTLSPTGGIRLNGEGKVALCPCPDPPITLAFSAARVEPPGDLVVDFPRLAIAGVPVLALPWLWLRSPDTIGLLPPLLAWRGDDGLVIGGGVHLPWPGHALQIRGAGYIEGGAEAQALFTSLATTTRVAWQEIHGRRVVVDAHGSLDTGGAGLAWDIDAARGDRARSAAPDLRSAVLPFDSLAAETSLRVGPGASGAAARFATGVAGGAERGEGAIAVGPSAFMGGGGPIGAFGTWEAAAGGLMLGGDRGATPLARAHLGAEVDTRPGPLDVRLSSTLRARIVGLTGGGDSAPTEPGDSGEPSRDAMAAGRLEVRLPFVRVFPAAPGDAPIQHWVVPVIEARAAALAQAGPPPRVIESPGEGLARPPLRDAPPTSWTVDAGLSTAVGRYTGQALSLDVRLGALGRSSSRRSDPTSAADPPEPTPGAVRPAARARVAAHTAAASLGGEIGVVGPSSAETLPADARADGTGAFGIARARLGRPDRVTLRIEAAAQNDLGAGEARAIADGSAAALPGEALELLAEAGFSGAAELGVPWTRSLRTSVRADADLTAGELLALQGVLSYRHPCGCLGFTAAGAHRLGRGGVDIALSIDLLPTAMDGGSGRPSLHSVPTAERIPGRVHQRPSLHQEQHPAGQ